MDYVLFMDETGDHNLRSIDHNFPVFCLAGCIFERRYYHQVVRPRVDAFKKRFWGTTDVILHSRDIRKHQGPFAFLGNAEKRGEFYTALNGLMRSNMTCFGNPKQNASHNRPAPCDRDTPDPSFIYTIHHKRGICQEPGGFLPWRADRLDLRGIRWVIVGGESGPGARPIKEEGSYGF